MTADWTGAIARARAHAPYLAGLLDRLPELTEILAAGDGAGALAWARAAGSAASEVGSALRREKQALALALAIGDLAGAFPLLQVTGELSAFADHALHAAIAEGIRRRVPDAEPAGFLALSAAHVTANPPTMLVSIGQKTSALSAVVESGSFAINYLAKEREDLAALFGGRGSEKGADRFKLGEWTTLMTGAPVLVGAVGSIDCRVEETIERYDVTIVLGRIVDWTQSTDRLPLVLQRTTTSGLP